MSFEIKTLNDGGLVVTFRDTISNTIQQELDHSIYRNPDRPFSQVPYIIFDNTSGEKLDLSSDDLRIFAKQDQQLYMKYPDLRVAIVVPNDAIYGMFRMWRAYLGIEADQVMIFREFDKAKIWIKEHLPTKH